MNILVLNGSPRKSGNTDYLVKAFVEGAEGKGHEVTVVSVGSLDITGCKGCEYCHTKGNGTCIQKDDMTDIYPLIAKADMVVLASSVYYWSFTGQLQSCITRFYAPGKPAAKKYALVLSSGSEGVYNALISQYHDMLEYFGADDCGIITVAGENNKTEKEYDRLREFGASL